MANISAHIQENAQRKKNVHTSLLARVCCTCGSFGRSHNDEIEMRRMGMSEARMRDNAKEDSSIKVLLLGAGSQGKSTLFKQLQILYGDGFDDQARNEFAGIIRRNCIHEFMDRVQRATESFGLKQSVVDRASFDLLQGLVSSTNWSPDINTNVRSELVVWFYECNTCHS